MEALLEKEGKVENWNDDRLDELSRRMDAGFDRVATKEEVSGVKGEVASVKGEVASVKEEMNRRFDENNLVTTQRFDEVDRNFGKVEHEFARVTDRLDKLFYLLAFFAFSLVAGYFVERF